MSCFIIRVIRNNKIKAGWSVQASFEIGSYKKDKFLLERIEIFLNCDNILKLDINSF